jgi:hypothetical protein
LRQLVVQLHVSSYPFVFPTEVEESLAIAL